MLINQNILCGNCSNSISEWNSPTPSVNLCTTCKNHYQKLKIYSDFPFEKLPTSHEKEVCRNCEKLLCKFICLECTEDNKYLCLGCSLFHSEIKSFRGHKIISLSTKEEEEKLKKVKNNKDFSYNNEKKSFFNIFSSFFTSSPIQLSSSAIDPSSKLNKKIPTKFSAKDIEYEESLIEKISSVNIFFIFFQFFTKLINQFIAPFNKSSSFSSLEFVSSFLILFIFSLVYFLVIKIIFKSFALPFNLLMTVIIIQVYNSYIKNNKKTYEEIKSQYQSSIGANSSSSSSSFYNNSTAEKQKFYSNIYNFSDEILKKEFPYMNEGRPAQFKPRTRVYQTRIRKEKELLKKKKLEVVNGELSDLD